ncbi:MAG: hypothetical protein LUF82_02430 [Clostridia bacterium]|nr:hypothetical protein [Clostridia bacterium]
MVDNAICSDLSARCGGDVNISLWGDVSAGFANSADIYGEDVKINFLQQNGGSRIHILVINDNGDLTAGCAEFASVTQGCARAVVYRSQAAQHAAEEFAANCGCPCVYCDWDNPSQDDINSLLRTLLFEFPLSRIDVEIPEWTQVMPQENSAIAELLAAVSACSANISKMSQLSALDKIFEGAKYWNSSVNVTADLKTGCVKVEAAAKDGIYFEMLSEIAGEEISGEYSLMKFVRSAADAGRGYAKVKDALLCASVNGYGIVQPAEEDISYEAPSVIRQGGSVGIKLKASAPSYHIIRVDVSGEVNPIMGSAAQSENMVQGMMSGFERDPEEMWNTDLFGKTLKSMVQEGLAAKVSCMQEETRGKLRRAVNRMVNEGKGGAIVIIL